MLINGFCNCFKPFFYKIICVQFFILNSQFIFKHWTENKKMTVNLPLDIIFHILTRLPAKSPLWFRCVSKSPLFSSSWSTMDLCPAVADNHVKNQRQTLVLTSPLLPVYSADHEAKNDAKAAEVDYPLKNRGFLLGYCY